MLHSRESLCQYLSVDIKYIDITENVTTQWAKMFNTLDFCKSEKIVRWSYTLLAVFQ